MNEAQHQPPIEPTPALQQTRTDSLKGSESSSSTRGVVDVARHVDDEWRRWIAENLMLGSERHAILAAMVGSGIHDREATYEIDLAMQSPYVRGAELLRTRLGERNRSLSTRRILSRMNSKSRGIDRRHRLYRGEFFVEYYQENRPVLITGMMDDWTAMTRWNLTYFAEKLRDREVMVRTGGHEGANRIAREKPIARMKFSEFVQRVQETGVAHDFYLTAEHRVTNQPVMAELWRDIGQLPEFLDGQDSLTGSLWLGPPGATIPFRHDLANKLIAQVIGRSRVKLAPSWDVPLMQNDFHCYSKIDGRTRIAEVEPGIDEPQIVECMLGPGEILFLPVGWMHLTSRRSKSPRRYRSSTSSSTMTSQVSIQRMTPCSVGGAGSRRVQCYVCRCQVRC